MALTAELMSQVNLIRCHESRNRQGTLISELRMQDPVFCSAADRTHRLTATVITVGGRPRCPTGVLNCREQCVHTVS
jgi:hypothetical protein